MDLDDLYRQFSRFGKVLKIQLIGCSITKKSIASIEFEEEQIWSQLISKRHFYIHDRKAEISPLIKLENLPEEADFMDESLQPPEQDSQKHILNILNDDCLREIFHKFQHYSSLFTVANVCVRFNEIAKGIFASEYGHKKILLSEIESMKQKESLLSDFGFSIKSLVVLDFDLYEKRSPSIYLKMINRYCKNLTALEFTFDIMNMDNQTLIEINPLLSRLTSLSLTGDWSESSVPFVDFIPACSQLETLKLSSLNPVGFTLPNIQLPKLTEFNSFCHIFGFNSFHYVPTSEVPIEAFLACNKQLKSVEIRPYSIGPNTVLNLLELRVLKISRDVLPIIQAIVVNNVPIEHLELRKTGITDYVIDSISKIKSISNLLLDAYHGESDNYLIQLAKGLPNLKQLGITQSTLNLITIDNVNRMLVYANQLTDLSIWTNNDDRPFASFNEGDYNAVLNIIDNRIDRGKLTLNIFTHTPTQVKPNTMRLEVLNMHSDRLVVKKYYTFIYV